MNLLFREKQKSQDEIIKQTDFNYQMVNSKIEDKKTYIDDISNRSKDLVDSKKLELTKADTDIENYNEDVRSVKTDIAGLQKQIIDSTKITTKHQKLHTMEAKLENTCNKHKKDLRFFESHDDCPTCQQVIDAAFKSTMIDKKKDKVTELDVALGQIETDIKTNEMKLDNINKTMVLIREKELLINRYETSINQIESFKNKIQKEVDDLSTENQSTSVQVGELNQLQEQLVDLEKDKISQKDEMIYIDAARHLMQDTGIKTKIIKQYLPIMNQFINKNLADMDFFVNFSLDEEFNETIKSRHRDEFNYHSFSEGEKLRIDLAILFTWREIAKLKNSTNTNLLILDEIFDSSLDTSGTDEFMRILHTTMDKENVFVISHKGDTLIDKFPRVMKFEKYKNFTRMAE
jgi:DNA repair exonuclease SbcCD ATPase subunit